MTVRRAFVGLVATAMLVGSGVVAAAAPTQTSGGDWVGTWGAAAAGGAPDSAKGYPNYSIRNVVHSSVGGQSVRVRLSNEFGSAPLVLGHVSVAVAAKAGTADAVPATMRELTFGGAPSITVPAGAEVNSDAVALAVPADANLLVTVFTPQSSGPVSYHPLAEQTSFRAPDGDHALDSAGTAFSAKSTEWDYLSEVDVRNSTAKGSVIAFGDSITDGYGSTSDTNHRWPDYLADRLGASHGVLNMGISGNRVLLDDPKITYGRSALHRLDDDALTRTAPRTMILLEGINDMLMEPRQLDANQIIAGYRQIITRAHEKGIKVLGATVIPYLEGKGQQDPGDTTRHAVNDFIRTGGVFDGFVDFDAAVRDPADPTRILPAFDAGDHIHPNDAGYQAMANVVDLAQL